MPSRLRLLRPLFVVAALAFCAWGLASRWDETRDALAELSWPAAGASLLAGAAGLLPVLLAWRCLLAGLGSPLSFRSAVRIFSVAQLGKYVPGSVWALVAQVELARAHKVPRERAASATLLAMATTVATGCAVAAATLPLTSGSAVHDYWWLLPLAPVFLAALHPRVVMAVIGMALRVLRRPPLRQTLHLATMVRAVGWSLAGWALFGVHAWLLVWAAGGTGADLYFLAAGAYALAFTLGFLFIIAPGGIGVREAAFVAVLAPALPAGAPLVVALMSRVLMTLADLAWASAGIALGRRGIAANDGNSEPDEAADTDVRGV